MNAFVHGCGPFTSEAGACWKLAVGGLSEPELEAKFEWKLAMKESEF